MQIRPQSLVRAFLFLLIFSSVSSWAARGTSNPIPQINPIVPASVAPGGSAFSLTLIGTGFVSASQVKWNGADLTTHFVSAGKLTADVPATNIASAGSAWITVTNAAPGGGTSLPAFLRIATPESSPSFVSYTQSTIFNQQGIVALLTGDFNGDGKLDLVFSGDIGTDEFVVDQKYFACIELGNGDGSFQSPVCTPNEIVMAVGDFNGDGKLDVITAPYNSSTNVLSVNLGNGDGTLGAPITFVAGAPGTNSERVGVADVNEDGKLDLVVQTQPDDAGNSSISILIGNGDGTFQAPAQYSPSPATFIQSMLVGDFDRDGNIDIIFTGDSPNPAIYFASGNGDGSFKPAVVARALTPNEPTILLAVADLHGTGTLDLVASENPPTSVLIAIFSGNGDGTFQAPVEYSFGTIFGNVGADVGDLNADGKLDLAVSQVGSTASTAPPFTTSSMVGYQLGNGDGTFQTAIDLTTPTPPPAPRLIVAGDFNGDGRVDMAVVLGDPASLQIYLQGSVPVVTVSPAALTFTGQAVNTTSSAQIIKIANTGTTALTLSGATITGADASQFAKTSTCGSTLAGGASCQISVTFVPTNVGTYTASVSIPDSAVGNPQTVALSGSTSGGGGAVSPSAITFPSQYVGTTGLPQTVTVTNGGNVALTISKVEASSSDFGVLNSCGSSVAAGSSCSIGVFFDPTASGTRTGTLTITDSAVGGTSTVALSGKGEDFSVSAGSSSSATVNAGQTASYTLSVAPAGGFAQSVALTCSGAPAGAMCSVTPSNVAVSATTATKVSVSVTTTARSSGWPLIQGQRKIPLMLMLMSGGSLLLMLVLVLRRQIVLQRAEFRLATAVAIVLVACVAMTLTSCGGGSSGGGGGGSGTQVGSYTITVTGTFSSGATNLSHATKLSLVVQ